MSAEHVEPYGLSAPYRSTCPKFREQAHGDEMANCTNCGKKLPLLGGVHGLCSECHIASIGNSKTNEEKKQEKAQELATERQGIEAILLTTETAPNLNIVERIEIVTAECAFGMNIFRDLFAAVRDVVGGRSEAVQKTMRDARKTALHELKREAWLVGANAVVGVDLDYTEISSSGNMILLVASGTAVRIG